MAKILLGLAALLAAAPVLAASSDTPGPSTVVESVYDAFARGDMETFAGLMAPDNATIYLTGLGDSLVKLKRRD